MGRKLMLLAALDCAAGGWLLGPASAQPRSILYCDRVVGTACSGPVYTTTCVYPGGGSAVIHCSNGKWVYA